jgi:rubredoxin-NAD+ reductase
MNGTNQETRMNPIVIIGSGMAGYTLLREFRKRDAATPVTLITADDGRAYSKPNLSNALAQRRAPEQLASETAEQAAAKYGARILTHSRLTAIDAAAKQIATDQGEIAYDRLVLALGADPIPHGLAGDGVDHVYAVNDLADYGRFRAGLEGARKVAILGGGLIGCEFANDLASAAIASEVVNLGPYPLNNLLPPEIGTVITQALAEKGVTWRFGRTGKSVEKHGDGIVLILDDGSRVEADRVLSAIGLRPRTALAAAAGLVVKRGIVVDRQLRTSDPDVFALGDCAEVEGLVLPYVQPLLLQVKALAATLAAQPASVSYPAMPVVVKTPACPLVVLPPPQGMAGEWQVEGEARDQKALFQDGEGRLRGFALTGKTTPQRLELAKEIPGMLS